MFVPFVQNFKSMEKKVWEEFIIQSMYHETEHTDRAKTVCSLTMLRRHKKGVQASEKKLE